MFKITEYLDCRVQESTYWKLGSCLLQIVMSNILIKLLSLNTPSIVNQKLCIYMYSLYLLSVDYWLTVAPLWASCIFKQCASSHILVKYWLSAHSLSDQCSWTLLWLVLSMCYLVSTSQFNPSLLHNVCFDPPKHKSNSNIFLQILL